MNTKLKCIVKDCNNKVLINLQTTDLENTSIQFFKMCKKHKLDFNNKVTEIKEYYKNNDLRQNLNEISCKYKK